MSHAASTPNRARRMVLGLVVVAVLMFGFGFAMVPLYDTLCRVLGINGKVEQASQGVTDMPIASRQVRVEFVVTNNGSLDWTFEPMVPRMTVQTNEVSKAQFFARNDSDRTMTVQAIPNVSPAQGARYLRKTECFCFQRQTLQAGESLEMPVVFSVSPELPERYKTLTLSYTLFDTEHLQ